MRIKFFVTIILLCCIMFSSIFCADFDYMKFFSKKETEFIQFWTDLMNFGKSDTIKNDNIQYGCYEKVLDIVERVAIHVQYLRVIFDLFPYIKGERIKYCAGIVSIQLSSIFTVLKVEADLLNDQLIYLKNSGLVFMVDKIKSSM